MIDPATSCTPDETGRCVICSDEGILMRVVSVDAEADLAICVAEDGALTDVMTALVGDVRADDRLLVHAGTALLRLDAGSEGDA